MHEPLRILIVDDDPGMAETLGDVLEAKGYEVEITFDGPQALALVQAKPRDVIFLDIKMPQMNGVEVLRRLKAMSPGTLVVMISAYALPELVAEAERLGALAILAKPLPLDRIIQFLETLTPVRPVLIVHKNATLASSLQEFLRSHGYPAAWVAGVAQTVDAVRQFRPDVILLDPKVLLCEGNEVLQAIRKVDPTSTILLMAGEDAELARTVDRGLQDEARIRLHMSLTPAEILQEVNEVRGVRIERAACQLRG